MWPRWDASLFNSGYISQKGNVLYLPFGTEVEYPPRQPNAEGLSLAGTGKEPYKKVFIHCHAKKIQKTKQWLK